MAILAPASFGRLTVPSRAQVRVRVSASANPRTSVDWVKETSSFFEQDKRPIMLFDGDHFDLIADFFVHLSGFVEERIKQIQYLFESYQEFAISVMEA